MKIYIVDIDGIYMLRNEKQQYWMGADLNTWENEVSVPWPGHQPPPGWMTKFKSRAVCQKYLLEAGIADIFDTKIKFR